MKYLIILIIIGIVIWGLINVLNIQVSTTFNDTNEDTHRSSANEYLSKFKEGILFPETKIFVWPASRNFSVRNGINICEENAFMLSKLTKEEFLALVEQLTLEKTPNLFEFWPDAFFYENINDAFYGWDTTKVANEYTYYGENPDMQIEMAARYENDKVFIRTKAKVEIITDKNGKWIGTQVLDRR
jgi:hypothetical protein